MLLNYLKIIYFVPDVLSKFFLSFSKLWTTFSYNAHWLSMSYTYLLDQVDFNMHCLKF